MAEKIGIKMRSYAISAAFVGLLATAADALVSVSHEPDPDILVTAAEPARIATSTPYTLATVAPPNR